MHQSCFNNTKLTIGGTIIGGTIKKEMFAIKIADNECSEVMKVKDTSNKIMGY